MTASATHSHSRSWRRKTFTGCWDCRSRKCDEATPECAQCRRRGFLCSGYRPVLVWVTPNQKNYEAGRRRILKSYSTWQDHRIHDSSTVDSLIAKCDAFSSDNTYLGISAGPFTVFASSSERVSFLREPPFHMHSLLDEVHDVQLREYGEFLFHHYTTYVALNMMPFEDRRNPWQSVYPLIARCGTSRGHKALLHAMLAQAAGNLASLGSNEELMPTLAVKHYALAIEDLRKGLEDEAKDFSVVLASVLTLVMAEVYNGRWRAWKMHLKGAWDFIISHQCDKPWQHSEEAWLMAQSLCLLKVRCNTMENLNTKALIGDASICLMSSVGSRPYFGFTVGASPALISCIIETTQLASKVSQHGFHLYRETVNGLYHRLQTCLPLCNSQSKNLPQLHHRIFQLGAIIYFHRSLFKSCPRSVSLFLDELLQLVKLYRDFGGGYVTLWPVFMAAVEAYQECHQEGFRDWLDECEKMGAASRKDIRYVIEAVWRKRASLRQQIGNCAEPGGIVVDWRAVMWEKGLDILLV